MAKFLSFLGSKNTFLVDNFRKLDDLMSFSGYPDMLFLNLNF